MMSRVIRMAAVSALCVGGTFAASSAAFAQETTTTVAAVATETTVPAAAVAETTVPAAAEPAATEAPTAVAPAGAVAAGGGFNSKDGNNTLPIVLAGAALVAGAGVVVARRRKA